MSGTPLKFLKLGGSLLTDKSRPRSLRASVLRTVARAVANAWRTGGFRLLVGHGGGSFGHSVARDYDAAEGLRAGKGWEGFHRTREAMLDLDARVVSALREAGVDAAPVQPSSACSARDGIPGPFATGALRALLRAGAVPVIFGDAVPDSVRGFTILSTEILFSTLARVLKPSAVLELSDVPGILRNRPGVGGGTPTIPVFTRANLRSFRASAGHGADVTGGIASKARLLVELAERLPGAEVRLLSGRDGGDVEKALLGVFRGGTLFRSTRDSTPLQGRHPAR
jgi:isopentenyl phosphate kinase